MASACVNNIGVSPESFQATTSYSSYGWLNPRISFSRDDESSSKSRPKSQSDPSLTDHPVHVPGSDQTEIQDVSPVDFEFRLEDTVAMLPADELFSDGKLVPLHFSSLKQQQQQQHHRPINVLSEIRSPETSKSCRRIEMEISGTDPYLFSPRGDMKSGNYSSSSSSLWDLVDGCPESFLLYGWASRDRDGKFGIDWYDLNLENNEIRQSLSRMPPAARLGSTAIAWLNHIYVLGGVCSRDPTCPDGEARGSHSHDYVFYFDSEHPENGWRTASPMLHPRMGPAAVAIEGKIYVFGGFVLAPFAEVFDINRNSWALLPAPSASNVNPLSVSYPVLLDSSRSRILVHFSCSDSLYAYSVDHNSWDCLNENFGEWSGASVIVDGVLYFLAGNYQDLYHLSAMNCSLRAYDVVENKWLPVKWLSGFSVYVPDLAELRHLGNGKFCLAWYSILESLFNYIKFSVCKNSGEIYATGESESVTSISFETSYGHISLL